MEFVSLIHPEQTTLQWTWIPRMYSAGFQAFQLIFLFFFFFLWQVLHAAWAHGVEVACENALTCYRRSGYDQILSQAKPKGSKHTLAAFTYLRLTPELMEKHNLGEFTRFVNQLHGTVLFSLPSRQNYNS